MKNVLERIADKAFQEKKLKFTSLAHHVNTERLSQALKSIQANTAYGIDGKSKKETVYTFKRWSAEVIDEIQKGCYKPPACKRVYIPKPGNAKSRRPIAIPTVKDRAVQRATAQVLNAIYEQDFLDCSFGGRPGRSAHNAIATLHRTISTRKVNWIMEVDLKNFFGSLSHRWVEQFFKERIGDPRIIRLIKRWLKAGVIEEGQKQQTEQGTAQGGSISVLISNVYLHYVLDLWIEKVVKRRLKGEMYYIRYLDDFVLCFQYQSDAKRVEQVLGKRLGKFGLEIAPEKSRMIRFGRFVRKQKSQVETNSLNFLGITFYPSKTRKGSYKLGMKTQKSRVRRSFAKTKLEIARHRHKPLPEQAKRINQLLRGHYQYYGVAENSDCISRYYYFVVKYWRKMLSSRSQKGKVNWEKYRRILTLFPLAPPRLVMKYSDIKDLAISL